MRLYEIPMRSEKRVPRSKLLRLHRRKRSAQLAMLPCSLCGLNSDEWRPQQPTLMLQSEQLDWQQLQACSRLGRRCSPSRFIENGYLALTVAHGQDPVSRLTASQCAEEPPTRRAATAVVLGCYYLPWLPRLSPGPPQRLRCEGPPQAVPRDGEAERAKYSEL